MDLPVYEMVISNEETSDIEVAAVALVDKPAIEKNFLAFKNNRLEFAINEEKRIISGPAMVADQLIYRKDENGEYNVFFSPQTVRDIAVKFFKKDYQKNLNLFHDPNLPVEGVTIFESFVSDSSRGIMPMKGFEDLPDGTWFISAKIDNDSIWQKIKAGEVKGFSVEGIFSFMKKGVSRTEKQGSHLHSQDNIMSDLKNLWEQFKQKFLGELPPDPNQNLNAEVVLKDGSKYTVDKLEVGGVMMQGDAPCPPGEYEAADGTKITIGEGGMISAIMPMGGEPPMDYTKQFGEINNRFTQYDEKFNAHIQAFQTMMSEFNQLKEQTKELVALVGKIIETPTAEPLNNQSQFNSKKDSLYEKRKELADILSKIKK